VSAVGRIAFCAGGESADHALADPLAESFRDPGAARDELAGCHAAPLTRVAEAPMVASPSPVMVTWLKLVQTVGADRDERAAEVVGKGVGDGQGLPAGLVGSEELFRLHDRTTRSFVQGCAVA
jgi:hypothetical protein